MLLKKLTLPELLSNSCAKFKNHLSLNFVQSGKRTYQDFYNEVISIANYLLASGIRKGDKVAILSANMPSCFLVQLPWGRYQRPRVLWREMIQSLLYSVMEEDRFKTVG